MTGRVVLVATFEQTLAGAAAAFLAQPSLARSTRRSYDQTLTRLVRELGGARPLSTLTVEAITVAVTTAWSGRAPATWNRQVATVRSFLAFCRRRRWLIDDLTGRPRAPAGAGGPHQGYPPPRAGAAVARPAGEPGRAAGALDRRVARRQLAPGAAHRTGDAGPLVGNGRAHRVVTGNPQDRHRCWPASARHMVPQPAR